MILAKEKFNKNTPVKKCVMCAEIKPVYIEDKIRTNHEKDSTLCGKSCFKRAYGGVPTVKKSG